MSKLIVIDGNSIASRAFYALPLLSNSNGLHTNAVFGFTKMLLKLIQEQKPTHFMVAFDAGKITFRHQEYGAYKGGRQKTPPELSEQFPVIKETLEAFGINRFELEGYEADDIIGTLTKAADDQGLEVLVVTGDKDMLQLASDHVTIALTRKGISEVELYNPDTIKEKYGLSPLQIIDLKGLMGDTSDNIPGIPGVGEKTALKLLQEYGSVETVLERSDELKGKMKEKVQQHAEDARMSKELATIFREVPMELELDKLVYSGYEPPVLGAMFRKLEFKSLLEELDLTGAGIPDQLEDGGSSQGAVELSVQVLSKEDLAGFSERLDQMLSLHIETYGDNPHLAEIVGAAFYEGDSRGVYVPYELLTTEEAEPIRTWLQSSEKPKRVFDAHRIELALHWKGIGLAGVVMDTQLAAYLLDPTESSLTLHALAVKYKVSPVQEDEAVFGKGAKYHLPEQQVLAEYLVRKAMVISELSWKLEGELKRLGMDQLYYDLELPLSGVLARMEKQGIQVKPEVLQELGAEFASQLEELMSRIYELGGGEFNINSPKQLGEVLFDRLGLSTVGVKKNKTGYSTDADVLEKLKDKHEIVRYILDYRTLAKLQSTYVEGLLKEIRKETGKIHTYFRQTIAATGRLSSQYPNLQNIPIRLEEGRKLRKAFVPSEPGWRILAADYSQIELRVLAHISQDERLIEAFRNDMDVHTKTAMDVFGVAAEQVDANMRRQAKAVNFGIVYGISSYGLSQNLDILRSEADRFIEQYFAVFQGVRAYMDEIVKQAKRDGYVTTLLARRRYLPEINASNFNLRSFAERTAMNTPIQGTAADIIKLAMVKMEERLQSEKLRSRLLLQVHDELVFEVPEEELETMQKLVPEVMAGALELLVPLKADVSLGDNWYEAK